MILTTFAIGYPDSNAGTLPDEFVQEAEEAMNGSIAELEAKVWKIRQKIIMRTRGLNIKKRDVVPMFHQIKNEITAEFGIEVEAADVLIMSCLNEAADAAEAYMQ
ncbi:hypothetical protein N7456_005612 [Penicillium angulare]|uniref:Uncharacterized protein n=1 Tax=Penicillium angulare TaxID=116970 RepID=A0A9W9G0D5_9EURO|nr:hypothetical protein N7456_005612 [Penicillium angulare]